ncbi:META domain-containing protein [Rhodobacterales bacterium HKCCE3408]|nr:META domain-containing protein [Rhodobacterales bacterium HKCCE3408]
MKSLVRVVSAITAFACAVPVMAQDEPFVGAHGATVPGSYAGAFDGRDWHLDLWPDQAFHLRLTPADGGTAEAFAGRWHADGRSLFLDLGARTEVLEVRNSGRLRPDSAPEDAGGDLVGEGPFDPAAISLPVSGMFTYLADAAIFTHCATDHSYPVVQEGAYLELETAYLADQMAPGEPLFVTLDATIETREQMEGPDRLSVVVDGFGATWPGEECGRAMAAPGLDGTVWRIRKIGDTIVDWSPPASEPFLTIDAAEGRFSASVGCNRMLGGVTVTGDGLSFGPAASTMMACPDDLAALEAQIVAALPAVTDHAIGGRTLRLLDAGGGTVAEFEAVYLP